MCIRRGKTIVAFSRITASPPHNDFR